MNASPAAMDIASAPASPSSAREAPRLEAIRHDHWLGASSRHARNAASKSAEGTILAAGLMLVLPEIPDSNPSKPIVQDYIQRYQAMYGEKPATFGANVYDAGLLLQHAIPAALKSAKPGTPEFRSALRDALEQTRELVATQGVYTMTPEDHSGFDERGRELITVKDGAWTLLK